MAAQDLRRVPLGRRLGMVQCGFADESDPLRATPMPRSNLTADSAALPLDEQLLNTVGVAPDAASAADLLHAIA
jgi:hypothetical protein